MKSFFTLLVVILSLKGYSQYPKFEIQGSQVRQLHSSTVANQEYVLHIMLPSGYENSNKKYPVVYLMDSQWDFPLLTAIYGQQYFDGFIPPMIIVGVTWGGINPNPDSLRARDYKPTKEARSPQSGGAALFLSFLEKELFPFIENNYKADKSNRTLMGCSLGGLFTLYALFTRPELFHRYVAATPAIGWDNEVIYQYEKKYFEQNLNHPAKLFMCFGGVERSLPGFEKLTKQLSQRSYKSLEIKTRVLENTGHSGTKAEGYTRGLQYVFERPSLSVVPSDLQEYTGRYQLSNGNIAEIKLENKQLNLYLSPTNKYSLQAATKMDFYSTAEFLNVKFNQKGNAHITGFELERFGGVYTAVKIK
jgi:predicted alpha/beta superfamily hydrolase